MNIEKFLIKNTAGESSLTATLLIVGFIVINCKLLLSGITFAGITLSAFSGVEYAAAMGALGIVYTLRRNNNGNGGSK